MRQPNPERGYALTLMLVLLVAGSLYVIVNRLDASTLQAVRSAETARALQQAKSALIAYALSYRETHADEGTGAKLAGYGYMPCPDMPGDDGMMDGQGNYTMRGTAAGTCGSNNVIAIGLLPYRSLGLPELRDGDGNCLWYAVSGTHKNNPNSNAQNWDTRGQIEILDANGITVLSSTGTAAGAVAVVFAAGPAINNATLQQSTGREPLAKPCGTDSTQATAYLESLASPMSNGTRKAADGSLIGNDRLLWISATELYATVVKRETTFPGYINADLGNLKTVLSQTTNYNATSASSSYRLVVPPAVDDPKTPETQNAQKFTQQWADHIWFRKCTGSCTVLGSTCAGVLVWSGSGAKIPRDPLDNDAANKDYLADASWKLIKGDSDQITDSSGVGSSYDPATDPRKDVALCLNPV